MHGRGRQSSRKELRKQERVQKRRRRAQPVPRTPAKHTPETTPKTAPQYSPKTASKPKSESKRVARPDPDEDFNGFSDDDDESQGDPVVPKATRDRLAREDAEIADLEKKLGIKNRKSLPKSFQEDGLDELLGELDGDNEDENFSAKRKRKAEADEWLAQKRRKALLRSADDSMEDSDGGLDDLEGPSDLDDGDDFDEEDDEQEDEEILDDTGSAAEEEAKPIRKRENPYVAPTTSEGPVQKYIPPARRQESGSDAEMLSRIRRQTQGLINRLTESNLLAILSDIEKSYRDYPRQHVTSILVDLLLIQICEPTSLPDTLLILTAGFSTAVYQVIGPDFGAQLLQQTVERFKGYHTEVSKEDAQNAPKHTSNLITFMSEMYNFQLIGCNLIFDYVRLLLSDLSELNAELLLRIVRMAGQSLRRDDPLALKDIVALIGPAVKKVGEANLSVRTKFLIESINDLKNNKVKTGASASAVIQDHTTRMKKLLGSLNTKKLKATEPLRIGLKDIDDSDKRGKWWLVGASWAGRDGRDAATGKQRKGEGPGEEENDADSIDLSSDGEVLPDLAAIARDQNMNTDVRRAIFIAIMGALDYEDAYARLMKLRLTKHRQKEIAYVVMQCAGCENQYNPYYALVARRVCGDRRIKHAFQDGLWKLFRRLGESIFGDEADADEEGSETIETRRLFALAKVFGFLIANGSLGLGVLKCLTLVHVQPVTRDFLEVMFITLFLDLAGTDNDVASVFGPVADLPELSKGLQYFLKTRVRKSDLFASKKDAKKVKSSCQTAMEALTATPKTEALDERVAMDE